MTPGGCNSVYQRSAVTSCFSVNYASACFHRDGLRAIGTAIICDDDFSVDSIAFQKHLGFLDACAQCFNFVKARYYD
jgi:hypothetical protein